MCWPQGTEKFRDAYSAATASPARTPVEDMGPLLANVATARLRLQHSAEVKSLSNFKDPY